MNHNIIRYNIYTITAMQIHILYYKTVYTCYITLYTYVYLPARFAALHLNTHTLYNDIYIKDMCTMLRHINYVVIL